MVGLRPYHITPAALTPDSVPVDVRVLVAEISGSESVVHVSLGRHTWVSQSHGVHVFDVGASEQMYVQPDRFLYFDGTGALVA